MNPDEIGKSSKDRITIENSSNENPMTRTLKSQHADVINIKEDDLADLRKPKINVPGLPVPIEIAPTNKDDSEHNQI